MAVTAADIQYRLSGGNGNADPNASLGGVMSATAVPAVAANNLFDNVTPTEAAAGSVEHRCFYIRNSNATDALNDVKVWMDGPTPAPGSILEIGVDPAGVGDGAATGVATVIADETAVPAGVVFAEADAEGEALDVGTLAAGQVRAIWARRTIAAGAASSPADGTTFRFRGIPA